QIHRQHPVGAGFGDHVGHQLGGNRRAGTNFAVLAGIAEIGDHCGDAACAGAAQRIDDDQKLHQIVVGGAGSALDDEHVLATDIFADLDKDLVIGKAAHVRLDGGQPQIGADV